MQPTVDILARDRNGTLDIGVTSALLRRIHQHREGLVPGFTRKYRVHRLVWFEQHADMLSAIRREKQLKEWRRRWKLDLIEGANPEWRDLWFDLIG